MNDMISANTQAILLLTAPLLGGGKAPADLLTPAEYRAFARRLRTAGKKPSDLLSDEIETVLSDIGESVNAVRYSRLLARGFQLSQAVERWSARSIWVVSRADEDYPLKLKQRLRDDAPAVVYGCGNRSALDEGGLAVVGSRRVDDSLIEYTNAVGRLATRAGLPIISGGARGIDRAAMAGALESGGRAVGILADGLEKAAVARDNRGYLMEDQLTLISPYDPAAGFNVGNAMQRNKLIYALSDLALVVNSDLRKGGTWAGAVEQLEKRHLVPIYVRQTGQESEGLRGLSRKGAIEWPEPACPDELVSLVSVSQSVERAGEPADLFNDLTEPVGPKAETACKDVRDESVDMKDSIPMGEELFAKVRELLLRMQSFKTEAEIAADLNVSVAQTRHWLNRLVDEGLLEKRSRPVQYGPVTQQTLLD